MPPENSKPPIPTPENLLEVLQQLVKHGTEHRGEAVVLMYDEEDGYFISSVETGCHHYPVKDVDIGQKRETLADAIVAAVEWHNKEREPWYKQYLAQLSLPKPPTEKTIPA